MQSPFERLVHTVKQQGETFRRLRTLSGDHARSFDLFELGEDRFLIQVDLFRARTDRRRSLMMIRRSDLRSGRKGWLAIAASGAFSAVLLPLLSGRIGNLCRVSRNRRSDILRSRTVLGNITADGVDLLQRDTDFALLTEADSWLRHQGLALNEIYFLDNSPEILRYTRLCGQEWRIRPTVYTLAEMREAVARSWQALDTVVHYCVSLRGVHYLTYPEFMRMVTMAQSSPETVRACLREWVSLSDGHVVSCMRRLKHDNHHVIEFFGVRRVDAEKFLIPALERLLEGMTLGRMEHADVVDTMAGIGLLYQGLLTAPEYASLRNEATVRALYALVAERDRLTRKEALLQTFDARRTALPGATFEDGVPVFHPGADERTKAVIHHLLSRLTVREFAEYVNVYELRSSKSMEVSQIREIVIKTNLHPIPESYVLKRLNSVKVGYTTYLLTRATFFRSLGIVYPDLELLPYAEGGCSRHREVPYFLRARCPGSALATLPKHLFNVDPYNPESQEDHDVVLRLAELYGKAAAQNMIVKKFTPQDRGCRFGIGKEIFEFSYDTVKRRLMPASVRVCSIRGSMGWPNTECTEENLHEVYRLYIRTYAEALGDYWRSHSEACTLAETATAFFDGFEAAAMSVHWNYASHRESFDSFNPAIRDTYRFQERMRFVLWSLERMVTDIAELREHFMDAVRDVFIKVRI